MTQGCNYIVSYRQKKNLLIKIYASELYAYGLLSTWCLVGNYLNYIELHFFNILSVRYSVIDNRQNSVIDESDFDFYKKQRIMKL